jgi:hypothetical protein
MFGNLRLASIPQKEEHQYVHSYEKHDCGEELPHRNASEEVSHLRVRKSEKFGEDPEKGVRYEEYAAQGSVRKLPPRRPNKHERQKRTF